MPKTQKSLEESRNIRALIDSRYGIPRSVMQANWSETAIDLSASYQDGKKESKYAGTPFDLSGIGARHGQLSRFPQNIARWIVKFYTPEVLGADEPRYFENDLPTIIDPMAGHNSRLEAVWRTNRNYVGHDISASFMEMNRHVVGILQEENGHSMLKIEAQVKLVEGDSRDIDYPPVFDLCMTSPPYWDLEYYGPEAAQLGNISTYNFFLDDLERIAANCYRALKHGAFLVWEMNDFTKDGVFHPFAFDMMQRFKKVGFILHQIIIIDYGHGFLSSFAQDIDGQKLVSKEHSYLVVARKWVAGTRTRAEKRVVLSKDADIALGEGRIEHQAGFGSMFRELDGVQ